jgi:hypothetical protein
MFSLAGLPWPCNYTMSECVIDGYICEFAGLHRRQVDLVILCHTQYPPEQDVDVEFIDVNKSTSLLLNFKVGDASLPDASPWKKACPTLVGSGLIMARFTGAELIRPLSGMEEMQLQGWHHTQWKKDIEFVNSFHHQVTQLGKLRSVQAGRRVGGRNEIQSCWGSLA